MKRFGLNCLHFCLYCADFSTIWKGARVVESAGLENRNSLLAIEGSNPSPSALVVNYALGEVQEWLNWHAWRACVRVTVPWVRIPPSPRNVPHDK